MEEEHLTEEELRQFLESDDDSGFVALLEHVERCSECRSRLSRLVDVSHPDQQTEVAENLKYLAESETTALVDRTSLQQSLTVSQQDRFEILDVIAEGGMGVIVRAVDRVLKRVVALKVMKPTQGIEGNELLGQTRFVREARICGALQHPGVVPVHDLGLLHDGRPFLAMKLIEGRTLDSMIREKVALSRLLDVFARVCQTLAYAHSCNVVHRDLKPTNVMVGEFGEVQVMDWGLATISASHETEDVDDNRCSAGSSLQFDENPVAGCALAEIDADAFEGEGYWKTRSGSIFGTPAYMSPEQARGDTAAVSRRSDVFALGAVLCEILTGAPPCATMPDRKLLEFAREPEYERLRDRVNSLVSDDELAELMFDCLQVEPGQRPADATEVWNRVVSWRDSGEKRLRNAELETARADARAVSERKRRKLASALAIAVVVVAVTVTALLLFVGRQQFRELRAEQQRQLEVRQTESQIATLIRNADGVRANAIASGGNDPSLWQNALHEVQLARNLLSKETDDELRKRVDDLHADILKQMEIAQLAQKEEDRMRNTLRQLEEAHLDFIARVPRVSPDAGELIAVQPFERAFATFGITTALVPKEARDRFIEAPDEIKEAMVFGLWEWHHAYRQNNEPGGYYGSWLRTLFEYLDHDEQRFYLRRAYLSDDPDLTGRLLAENDQPGEVEYLIAADCYRRNARQAEAVVLLRKAIEDHPDSFWLNFYLADHYAVNSEPPMLESAANYYQVCAAVEPASTRVLIDQGAALIRQRRYERALEHFERLAESAPDIPEVLVNLSAAQLTFDEYEAAAENCRRALELDPQMLVALINLGEASALTGNEVESAEAYRKAKQLEPCNPEIYVSMARIAILRNAYEEAAAIIEPALELSSSDSRLLSTMVEIHIHAGRLEEAEQLMKQIIADAPEVASQYVNLSYVQVQREDFESALLTLKEAEKINPTDVRIIDAIIDVYRQTGDSGNLAVAEERRLELMRRISLRGDQILEF